MPGESIIPEQKAGAVSNTEYNVACANRNDAVQLYETAKARLLDISNWEKLAGIAGADFKLVDSQSNNLMRDAQVGDHVKIDIPGPGPATGDGYDWVIIEAIDEQKNEDEDVERIIIKVKPASNPSNNDSSTAHFFDSQATSNFIVRREKQTVFSAVLGRNEKPNQQEADGTDKLRNTVVATGAIVGAAKLQWAQLIRGLLAQG